MERTILPQLGDYLTDGARLLEGITAGSVGVWRWTVDGTRLDWSPNLEAVHRQPEGSFDGTLDSFQRMVDPVDADKVWASIQNTIDTGETYRVTFRVKGTPNAAPLWMEAAGELIEALDGTRYLNGTCYDVTERVLAQRELELRLSQQKALAEFGLFAFGEAALEPVLQRACEIAARVLDVPLAKILRFAGSGDHLVLAAGIGWAEGLVGTGAVPIGLESQAGYTLSAAEPVVVADLLTETRFSGPQLLNDHKVRSGMSVVIRGANSRPFGVFGVHTTSLRLFNAADVEFLSSLATIIANSARQVEAVDQSQLLLREMTHRAGNMMQMVSTIANQTFSDDKNRKLALHAFNERLAALARANYLIARGGWTSTRFLDLLREILSPFGARTNLDGPDLLLPPELCFDLGLVLHELATNSIRHGSLGEDALTQVNLSWSITRAQNGPDTLVLIWYDPVNHEPDPAIPHQGFGTRLLDALIVKKWNGVIKTSRDVGYTLTASIPFEPV